MLRTKGSGCPNCYGNVKKKYEEVVKLAYDKNNNIEILGVEDNKEFKNVKTKLKVKCKIDGYEWVASAGSLIATHNSGCPKCAGNLQKTTESFKEECYMRNKNIKMIGKYTGIYNKVKFKCSICETEFERVAHHVISHGLFCPHCNLSAGELKIKEFLNKNNVAYIPQYKFQDCKDIKSLPFDFYLPDYNTLIEYDGRQHFKVSYFGNETEEQAKENLLVTQKHDQIKTKYCEDNNIKLLRIPYWNYNNVENILEEELEI